MESYYENTKDQNQDIIDDLALKAGEEIGKIIASYDITKSDSQNLKMFSKESKATLVLVADFLKVPDMNANKSDLLKSVMSRIANLLLEPCRSCKTYYNVDLDEIPVLSCMFCGQGCHSTCLGAENANLSPGLFFICISCEEYELKKKLAVAPSVKNNKKVMATSAKTSENTMLACQESDVDTSSQAEQTSNTSNGNSTTTPEQQKVVCRFLKRGSCRHGITGKKGANSDEQCKFFHPVVCSRSRTKGKCDIQGCTKFHPKMCYRGINTGKCYNSKCKYWHHSKVERRRPKNDHDGQFDNSQPPSFPHISHRGFPRESMNSNAPHSNNNNSFLELKEEMKNFQQQLLLQVSQMLQNCAPYPNGMQNQFQSPAPTPTAVDHHSIPAVQSPQMHKHQWQNNQTFQQTQNNYVA